MCQSACVYPVYFVHLHNRTRSALKRTLLAKEALGKCRDEADFDGEAHHSF